MCNYKVQNCHFSEEESRQSENTKKRKILHQINEDGIEYVSSEEKQIYVKITKKCSKCIKKLSLK